MRRFSLHRLEAQVVTAGDRFAIADRYIRRFRLSIRRHFQFSKFFLVGPKSRLAGAMAESVPEEFDPPDITPSGSGSAALELEPFPGFARADLGEALCGVAHVFGVEGLRRRLHRQKIRRADAAGDGGVMSALA
jgi:hypothetical protein